MKTSERDIPIAWVGIPVLVLCVPTGALLWSFLAQRRPHRLRPGAHGGDRDHRLPHGEACGYLAGLLGSSSSPISGIGILTIMLVAGCGLAVLPTATPGDALFIGAVTLFVTSLVITACSIANDNLQDLKAGAIVGATPWKQQAALAIGVVFGAITIAPTLQLLYSTYGFVGAMPRPGMDASLAMPAPQAALLTQIADGIVNHQLDWTMVAIGGALGVVFIAHLRSAQATRLFPRCWAPPHSSPSWLPSTFRSRESVQIASIPWRPIDLSPNFLAQVRMVTSPP